MLQEALRVAKLIISAQEKCVEVNLISLPNFYILHFA